jgi:hypothetical protein
MLRLTFELPVLLSSTKFRVVVNKSHRRSLTFIAISETTERQAQLQCCAH